MKTLTILGDSPFELDAAGAVPRIGTLFPDDAILVTLPGIHATQRQDYLDHCVRNRQAAGLPALSEGALEAIRRRAVDLMFPPGHVQIRPDPDAMDLAFAADELLQTRVPKHRIHFLHADDECVRRAIQRRGESWRIAPVPRSADDIIALIQQSRMSIAGPAVYYYSAERGTRFLTCREFARLADLDDAALALQLAEIQRFSASRGAAGHPDMAFFLSGIALDWRDLAGIDFAALPPDELRRRHKEWARRFTAAVPRTLRDDDPRNPEWRNTMFVHLMPDPPDTTSAHLLPGIDPEFFLQIRWLPGGRIEEGELIFDSVFDQFDLNPGDPELQQICDLRVERFICNFIRELGTLEYVNVGFIAAGVRHHAVAGEAHRAYIAEIKHPGVPEPAIRILRLAKWGVREHLEQDGWDLLRSFVETEKYLDYIFDRRLGCWQLGMSLPAHIHHRRMPETYDGTREDCRGQTIWVHYFERDYIDGVATNKVPAASYRDSFFARAFARLLGETAAVNLVVGRMTLRADRVIFDDGDEILIRDERGAPKAIVVADHVGTFVDSGTDLIRFAAAYAEPVRVRREKLTDPAGFAREYLDAFGDRLRRLQEDYRKRRRAFDTLFKHQSQEPGSFPWRWTRVLARLDRTDVDALVAAVDAQIPR